jgi:hypothetical protein
LSNVAQAIIERLNSDYRWGIPERLVEGWAKGSMQSVLQTVTAPRLSVVVPSEPNEQESQFLQAVIEKGFGFSLHEAEIIQVGRTPQAQLVLLCGVDLPSIVPVVTVVRTLIPSAVSEDIEAKRLLWSEIKRIRFRG